MMNRRLLFAMLITKIVCLKYAYLYLVLLSTPDQIFACCLKTVNVALYANLSPLLSHRSGDIIHVCILFRPMH